MCLQPLGSPSAGSARYALKTCTAWSQVVVPHTCSSSVPAAKPTCGSGRGLGRGGQGRGGGERNGESEDHDEGAHGPQSAKSAGRFSRKAVIASGSAAPWVAMICWRSSYSAAARSEGSSSAVHMPCL